MSEYSYNADAKEATVFTKQHNAAFAQQFAIDLEDAYNSEVALARRGCLKKLDGFRLKDKTGNVVWDLQAYDFLKQQAVADTVHPSLWLNGKANIEAGVFDGAIILVHDIYKTSVDGALAAIDDLLAEGYEFVTVQDLLLRRGVTPEAATVYYSAKNNGINLPADAVGEQAFDESRIETHWGYAAMKTCLDYGWMMLTDTGEWKPNAFVTRAEFAADLARFAGIHTLYPLEGAARFSDVDLTAADAPYLAWAADSGIVAGYDDGTFRPEKTLTREQMAVMLARYYARSGVTTQGSLDFADAAKISGWAVDGVSVCVGLGLVQGDLRGRFLPQSRLTRAQIASILVRMAG